MNFTIFSSETSLFFFGVERVFNITTVTQRIFQIYFLCKDREVKHYSLFSVLYDGYALHDNFLVSRVFGVG